MRWRLAGVLPFLHVSGPDTDRSGAGRLAAEAVWMPSALLAPDVSWSPDSDLDIAAAHWTVGFQRVRTDLHLDAEGRLREVSSLRRGNPNGEPFAEYPFGGIADGEATFHGITIPNRLRVGWFHGTDRRSQGEVFRCHITDTRFL